jgi:hypothetical protein
MDLDAGDLQPIVAASLGVGSVAPAEWSCEPILAGDGQGLGVFRVSGTAHVGQDPRTWSVILKVLPDDSGFAPSAWSLARREPLAYASGLLDTLPDALGAPRCLRHETQRGRHLLWLEDLGGDDPPWSLADYAHAARLLGRFNGAYLRGRPVPATGWLSRDWLRSWLAEGAAAVEELPRHARHPLVRRVYPPALRDRIAELWARRERLLDALDGLPQVLCHHDAFRRNLFLRNGRLLAVDWAFLGPGPLGAELAPLVSASAALRGIDQARWADLERTANASYADGLADAGWNGSPQLPWLGFAATSALRYLPGVVRLLLPTLLDETAQRRTEAVLGIPFEQTVELWADLGVWQARLADQALSAV